MKQLAETEIHTRVQKWLRESVDMLEEWRVDAPTQSIEGVRADLADLTKAEPDDRVAPGRGDYRATEQHAERLLRELGVDGGNAGAAA